MFTVNSVFLMVQRMRSKHIKGFKTKQNKTLFIITKHRVRIFGLSPFFRLQNNS